MDDAVRLQYLKAMGIDVWVSRHPPLVAPQAKDASHAVDGGVGWAESNEAHHDGLENVEPADAWASLYTAHPPQHAGDDAWKDLQHEVSICRACGLCETRTQTVFGVGDRQADWLLIGEAPGQNEDLQGEPFVGKAGQLLNEMLRAIGLKREQVYIANMLKCRPPNNRDPQVDEIAACHGFLQQQIALIRPKIILAVGRIAAQNLLHTQQSLSRLRGTLYQLDGVPMTVVHHPAYLLRSPTEKAKAWEDLQFALSIFQSQQRSS